MKIFVVIMLSPLMGSKIEAEYPKQPILSEIMALTIEYIEY